MSTIGPLLGNLLAMICGGLITGIGIRIWQHDAGEAIGLVVVLVIAFVARMVVYIWFEEQP